MRNTIFSAVIAIAICGCVAPPQASPPHATDSPAACFTEAQCDAMWSEAAVQLQSLTGMKLQVLNDTFMQTFNPTRTSLLGGMARKVPMPDGSTAFDATFTCRYCNNLNYEALNIFTRSLKTVGNRFGSTTLGGEFTPNQSIPSARQSEVSQAAPAASKEQQLQDLQKKNLPYEQYQQEYRRIMGR